MARPQRGSKRDGSKLVPATGVLFILAGAGIAPAYANCSQTGITVTCNGAANPLAPSYSNVTSNLTVTVNAGATVGVLLGVGGTSMTLTGNDILVTNNGTISPTALGGSISILSSGLVVGNATASTATIVNNDNLEGATGASTSGATGMALAAQNGTGGVTNITNAGTISSNTLSGGATLTGADALAVMAYGGAQVNFNNSGTIDGRVSFQASGTAGAGNTFINSGIIDGSVALGADSTNTFTAETGSSLSAGGDTGAATNVAVGAVTLSFAATGTVDGGAGGNNTLVLQQSPAIGAPTMGSVTNTDYINFEHLDINSGEWTLSGSSTYQDATFNGGDAVIDNNTSLGTGTITSNGGGLTTSIAGINVTNAITLNQNFEVIAANDDFTLSGVISGSSTLEKSGVGTLTLSGINDYTGGTILDGGSLILGNASALGTGSLIVDNSATLDSTGSMSLVNDITIEDNDALTLGGSNSLNLFGSISGAGSLVKNGAATATLTGANSYTGGTTIYAGTLAIGAGGRLAASGALALTGPGATFDISAGGNQTVRALSGVSGSSVVLGANTLSFGDSTDQTFAGNLSGTGGVVWQGSGTETLTGANTYIGGTTILAGTLALGAAGSLVTSSAVTLAGTGTFDISGGGNQAIGSLSGTSGAVNLGGNTLTLGGVGNTSFGGTIGGAGGLVKDGTGVQTLSGANTFSGGVVLNAGGLIVGNNSALGTGTLTVGGNATLDSSSAITLNNNINLNAGLTAVGSNDLTLNGVLSGTGSLTKDGSATLTLNGTNTYTGGTFINAGTLALGAGASLTSSGTVNLAVGATLDLSAGNGTQTFGTLTGGGTVDMGANTLAVGGATNGVFGGSIAGTGGLVKQGTGTETLSGSNTFTGETVVNAGTLAIGAGGSLSSSTVVNLAAAGTGFDISAGGNQSIGALNGVVGSSVSLGASTLTLNGVGNTNFDGTIGGTGGLIENGPGVQTLDGSNTFAGGVTLNAGGLVLGNNNALGTGTLAVANAVTLDSNVSVSVTNNIVLGANAALNLLGSNAMAFSGVISGNGALIKSGASTLTLNGANTFSGGTTITAGTLALGAGGSLFASGVVTLSGSGTFDMSAAGNQTIGSLMGTTGNVNLGGNTLTLDDVSNASFAGTINGNGGLVKAGGGTMLLNGINTYTGGTTVTNGTLEVGDSTHSSATIQSDVTVDTDGTLRGHGSIDGDVTNDGMVWPGGSVGVLTINGNYAQSANGTLQIDVTPTQASELLVTGSASLAGSLDLIYAPGTYTATTYTLVQAKTLTGTFATTSNTGSVPTALNPQVNYTSTHADLVLAATPTPTPAPTPTPTPTPTPPPVRVAPLDGALYGNLMQSINLTNQQTLGTMLDTPITSADAGCNDNQSAHSQSAALPACHTGVWVQSTGSNLSFSGSNGLNASSFGLLAGADHAFDVAHVGVEAGVNRDNANDPLNGSGNAETAHAGLYSFAPAGPLWLSATADAAYNDYRINRATGIGDAVATPAGHTLSVGLQAAWPLQFAAWQLTPKLGALYQHQSMDGFNESLPSGNPLASAFVIRADRTTYTSLQPYGALAVTHSFVYQNITYVPELNAGYRYDTRGPTPPTVQTFTQDGSLFALPASALGRGLGTAGARITAEAGASWNLYLDYQGLFASHLRDNAFTFGFVKHF